ncbi:hypothetical protein SD77_1784 [Bacillus badius]|uniref:Uncharacterized protein n=1 Tax=Bacillus badius TaxID=1455 RepID=A0ABR5AQZ4_BACBA|nr:hypothetical protein SD78_4264 [Bacillus badius]KIL77179.1 hypothetical protein SD77_1784 [Bacillus badius]
MTIPPYKTLLVLYLSLIEEKYAKESKAFSFPPLFKQTIRKPPSH